MTELLIFCFLAGAVLGQRFRVLVLLPLTFVMLLAAIPVGWMANLGFIDGVTDVVLAAIVLQAGYLFGSAARFVIAGSRAARAFARPVKSAR